MMKAVAHAANNDRWIHLYFDGLHIALVRKISPEVAGTSSHSIVAGAALRSNGWGRGTREEEIRRFPPPYDCLPGCINDVNAISELVCPGERDTHMQG